jgi:2-polyprenyl-3-methyl-5-hydroxy-6-metoxy-1,4-benzoquinol methylase
MNNLDKYKFSTKNGFNSVLLKLRYEKLSKYFKGDSCLELGCADGEGTKILLKHFKRIIAVDGSQKLVAEAKNEISSNRVTFICSYFEDLKFNEKFDTIVLAHILEHVSDPLRTLKIARKFLKKGGVMIVDVPNALSIHRQVGVLMGMIKSEHALNSADLSIGHRRVYDMNSFKKMAKKADLKIIREGGLFMKPFSNVQMEKLLDKKGIHAFNEVGQRYPEIAAEIYIICKL